MTDETRNYKLAHLVELPESDSWLVALGSPFGPEQLNFGSDREMATAVQDFINRFDQERKRTASRGPYVKRSNVDVIPPGHIGIRFDRGPGPTTGRFVEVEIPDGGSVSVGEWRPAIPGDTEGDWFLVLRDPRELSIKEVTDMLPIHFH